MESIKGFMTGDKLCLSVENLNEFYQIIYIIFDYPYKHYTFNHFKV